ncbi:protein arginine kinase [Halobacillus kuroshimensis]|uniref:Protein-arginine kinase n=1 Tax=Halobacillus kuroshimensis TaxID=302481 RepID=A0ABS3E1I6_9BACI|nr:MULTISPECIES: protein arginine kinase [Halobacillus]MBN8237457.1 protein arginine kinase [Halobacillus kuroshimensis]
MSLKQFINEAISPWMKQEGPDSDIVMSSRIRLARNFAEHPFPIIAKEDTLSKVLAYFEENFQQTSFRDYKDFELVRMRDLQPVEKRVLVEKHLISPHLAEHSENSATLISQNEQVSIMVNEEDHVRIQLYFPGFQLDKALEQASQLDDWLEEKVDYAFDENRGYLTACPTNVGTGMRASVMMHLPALSMTQQINRMIPAINQLGLVVRGIYGEGSEALGSIFQISNQITLGKSEEDIVEDLHSVVKQLIDQERKARETLMHRSSIRLEDRIFRSYGVLTNSRIIESKEAAKCLSDLRLGIDLGLIDHIPRTILNELVILTQPGFLQQYAETSLSPDERDVRRASLIRERLQLEHKE